MRLPDCKPVSVPFRVAVIHLRRTLLCGSSNLPGSRAGRAAPPPLFGLAPRGACPAGGIAPAAVRSYRTISPLPSVSGRRYIFCGAFRRALRPSRPLAGTLPCGDRTFLSRFRKRLPIRQPHSTIVAFSDAIRPVNTPAGAFPDLSERSRGADYVICEDKDPFRKGNGTDAGQIAVRPLYPVL